MQSSNQELKVPFVLFQYGGRPRDVYTPLNLVYLVLDEAVELWDIELLDVSTSLQLNISKGIN